MVTIFCKGRIARLSLNNSELPKVDFEFVEITQSEETDTQ